MGSKPLRIECTVEVYGNTWEHREELRALGARWNPDKRGFVFKTPTVATIEKIHQINSDTRDTNEANKRSSERARTAPLDPVGSSLSAKIGRKGREARAERLNSNYGNDPFLPGGNRLEVPSSSGARDLELFFMGAAQQGEGRFGFNDDDGW